MKDLTYVFLHVLLVTSVLRSTSVSLISKGSSRKVWRFGITFSSADTENVNKKQHGAYKISQQTPFLLIYSPA